MLSAKALVLIIFHKGKIQLSFGFFHFSNLCKQFSRGRTEFLGELTARELGELNAFFASFLRKEQARKHQQKDKLRKSIIAVAYDMGRDVDFAKGWCEKYGTKGQKRKFNEYSEQELYALLQKLEKVRDSYKIKPKKS